MRTAVSISAARVVSAVSTTKESAPSSPTPVRRRPNPPRSRPGTLAFTIGLPEEWPLITILTGSSVSDAIGMAAKALPKSAIPAQPSPVNSYPSPRISAHPGTWASIAATTAMRSSAGGSMQRPGRSNETALSASERTVIERSTSPSNEMLQAVSSTSSSTRCSSSTVT